MKMSLLLASVVVLVIPDSVFAEGDGAPKPASPAPPSPAPGNPAAPAAGTPANGTPATGAAAPGTAAPSGPGAKGTGANGNWANGSGPTQWSDPVALFRQLDSDHDGKLSLEEFKMISVLLRDTGPTGPEPSAAKTAKPAPDGSGSGQEKKP